MGYKFFHAYPGLLQEELKAIELIGQLYAVESRAQDRKTGPQAPLGRGFERPLQLSLSVAEPT
jgi:hypothetical protein